VQVNLSHGRENSRMTARFGEELDAAIAEARAIVRQPFPWWLRPFVVRGVIGITLVRRIYISTTASGEAIERLLRHELTHVRQINRLGVVRFYWRYLAEFARNIRRGMSFDAAYRHISFEEEAFAAETYNRLPGTAE
jgi:hypothetical protein